jgi:hypothetical protein
MCCRQTTGISRQVNTAELSATAWDPTTDPTTAADPYERSEAPGAFDAEGPALLRGSSLSEGPPTTAYGLVTELPLLNEANPVDS